MGPGGTRSNPQQQPGTPFWHQPSQADRPALQAIGGAEVEPIIPPPSDWPQASSADLPSGRWGQPGTPGIEGAKPKTGGQYYPPSSTGAVHPGSAPARPGSGGPMQTHPGAKGSQQFGQQGGGAGEQPQSGAQPPQQFQATHPRFEPGAGSARRPLGRQTPPPHGGQFGGGSQQPRQFGRKR